jgi:hypothetical protein
MRLCLILPNKFISRVSDTQTMTPPRVHWRLKQINEVKESTRKELDSYRELHGKKKVLEFILLEINLLENDLTPEGGLKRFTYVMSALVHSVRSGGLTPKQFRNLLDLGTATLQINGVKPCSSSIAFLYGELHLITSQNLLIKGDTWMSAWEQQVSSHISGRSPPGGADFHDLSLALTLVRLGHVDLSLRLLNEVDVNQLYDQNVNQQIMARIRCFRLLGRFDEALSLLANFSGQTGITPSLEKDLQWESVCLQASKSNDLTEIFSLVRLGRPLYMGSYILEAWLHSWCHSTLKWTNRLAKISSMVQNKKLNLRTQGSLLKYCLELESFFDSNIPFTHRLNGLGKALNQIGDVRSVDKTMLIWLSATRALMRQNCIKLAAVCYYEYCSLSLRVSNGATNDVLAFAGDLADKDWVLRRE